MSHPLDRPRTTGEILDEMRREADALLAEIDELARELSEEWHPWEVPAFAPAAYASPGVLCPR